MKKRADEPLPQVPTIANLEGWLIGTRQGWIVLHRVIRKHWKKLLATAIGARFVDFIEKRVIADERNRVPVVVEISADGYVRVFGKCVSAVIVTPIATSSLRGEVLAEDIAYWQLSQKHREVYLDARYVAATGSVICPTVQEVVARKQAMEVLAQMDSIAQKYSCDSAKPSQQNIKMTPT